MRKWRSISPSRASSCCRSASITATNGALLASIPSTQAPARPRRPTRRMQRTRASCSPSVFATAAVPSGESSSTKMISHAKPASVRATRSTTIGTFARSLNVGTTTVSSGIEATAANEGAGASATAMGQAYSRDRSWARGRPARWRLVLPYQNRSLHASIAAVWRLGRGRRWSIWIGRADDQEPPLGDSRPPDRAGVGTPGRHRDGRAAAASAHHQPELCGGCGSRRRLRHCRSDGDLRLRAQRAARTRQGLSDRELLLLRISSSRRALRRQHPAGERDARPGQGSLRLRGGSGRVEPPGKSSFTSCSTVPTDWRSRSSILWSIA